MANTWSAGGDLSTARSDSAGFGTQTATVAAGGYDGINRLNTTEEYDGAAWAAGGNAVVTYRYLAGCGSLTAGLMNGGHNGTDGRFESSEYDGTSWTAGNNMSISRRSHSCFGTQTAAAINGGIQDLVAWRQDTEKYNGTSYSAGNPSSVVHVHVGYCGTQTAGLIIGGQNAGATRIVTVEEYNGTTWSAGGDVAVAARMHMAFGTQTSVVKAGGDESTGVVSRVESYDGTTWTAENSLSAIRALLRASGDSTNGFIFTGDSTADAGSKFATTEEWSLGPILLTGSFAAQSATTGGMAITRGLTGSFAAQSGTSGALTANLSLIGSFAAQSGTSGALIIITPGIVNLAGTFAAQSGSAGDINVIRGLIGSFAAQASMSGTLTVTGANHLFGGGLFTSGVAVEYQVADSSGAVTTAWTNTGVGEHIGPGGKSGYFVLITPPSGNKGTIFWRTPDLSESAYEAFDLNITATNMRGTDNANTVTPPTLPEIEASTVLAKEATGIAIKVKTDNLPDGVIKNQALNNFTFRMIDSTDGKTSKTGLTVTAQRSIDGAAFASTTNSPAEIGSGVYKISLSAVDLNGDVITLLFTATGAIDNIITILTQT